MNQASNIDPDLPFCDLHRHLDGSMRLQTILDLAEQHGIALPARTREGLKPHVQVVGAAAGLMDFIDKFRYPGAVLVNAEACCRVARENVEDAFHEGIDYIELRFSPWFMALPHRLDPGEVAAAVIEGTRAGAAATGIGVQLIGILSRTYGPQACMAELDALLAHRSALVGLDLAGDEKNFPPGTFAEHFRRAREAGWRITVHAGEADGPQSIWAAITVLGAERIGHGISALEDPRLLDYLVKEDIGLEVCLTSNVHTRAVDDLSRHPVRKLLDHGVRLNLNTDDPGISGIDLRHEYDVAAPQAGLDRAALRLSQTNAVEMAFLDAQEKSALIARKTGRNRTRPETGRRDA